MRLQSKYRIANFDLIFEHIASRARIGRQYCMVIALHAAYIVLLYYRYHVLTLSEATTFWQYYGWLFEENLNLGRRIEFHPGLAVIVLLLFLHFYFLSYKDFVRPSTYIGARVDDVYENPILAYWFITCLPVWPLMLLTVICYAATCFFESTKTDGSGTYSAMHHLLAVDSIDYDYRIQRQAWYNPILDLEFQRSVPEQDAVSVDDSASWNSTAWHDTALVDNFAS